MRAKTTSNDNKDVSLTRAKTTDLTIAKTASDDSKDYRSNNSNDSLMTAETTDLTIAKTVYK